MSTPRRFPFIKAEGHAGSGSLFPWLPLKLSYSRPTVFNDATLDLMGLLDTGATVNVLPYNIGAKLGVKWSEAQSDFYLSGTLADFPARSIVVTAEISGFKPVRLAFAWTKSNDVPVILGQTNFFMEFDVCFFRDSKAFEIREKKSRA